LDRVHGRDRRALRYPERHADQNRERGNWEIAMSDIKTKRVPQDAKSISFEKDDEIEYWTEKFGVARYVLASAVGRVGRDAEAVERYLKRANRW
jgi:CRISPR/Cas system CSM-associated protein Csm2 small subunit